MGKIPPPNLKSLLGIFSARQLPAPAAPVRVSKGDAGGWSGVVMWTVVRIGCLFLLVLCLVVGRYIRRVEFATTHFSCPLYVSY